MASVQFQGREKVVQASRNRACIKWAVFQSAQFLFKYEGEDLDESLDHLQQILECLAESEAVYTIRFYEDAGRIKSKTDYDGSFNFRLVEDEDRNNRKARYQDMEARLAALEDGEDDEDDEGDLISGFVNKLIDQPEKIEGLVQMAGRLFGFSKPQVQPAGAISGIAERDEDHRIIAAIAVLRRNDKNFVQHIEKLAQISDQASATFLMLIGMLEKF